MPIDLVVANAFLDHLCDEFSPKVTFQTFDDDPKKDPKLARVLHGTLQQHAAELTRLNELGAGVFVTVNRTDLKGRKKSNIVGVRSVFIDIDEAKELPAFEIPPSIVIDTPHGWHVYWLLEQPNEMTNDECERVNKALAAKYGGDRAVTDCARVLRVPGFDHCKGERQPITTNAIDDHRYDREQLLALIPKPAPKPKHQPPKNNAGRSRYGQTALEKECDAVAGAVEGERNIALNRASFSIGQLVAGGEIDVGDATSALLSAARSAGLGDSEAQQTMASGMRAGAADPRTAPRRGHMELAASDRPAAASAATAAEPDFEDIPMPDDEDAPGPPGPAGLGGIPVANEDWEKSLRWKLTDKGAYLTKDPGNIALLLANSEKWKGCLAYDEFAHRAFWLKPPPVLEGLAVPEGPLADEHSLYCRQLFAKTYDLAPGSDDMYQALNSAAKKNAHHPVRDYLEGIEWDGVPRLNSWLSSYLGADPCDENERIGRWWMISAVARIMDPGCQADHVLILEAPQGKGKTRTVRILAGDWYQGNLGDIRDKDGPQSLQGHWIVEIGELDALSKVAVTRIKDFLSQTVDIYRPAYGRYNVHRPRQCVFCGTTNDARYLKDATGGRRFWPVKCGDFDVENLELDRDQLWAEAVVLYRAGERWWPRGSAEVMGLTELQEQRYEGDPWEETIVKWLARQGDEISCDDVLAHLEVPTERWDKRAQMRVGTIMARIGWGKHRRRIAGVNVWRWLRPEDKPDLPF